VTLARVELETGTASTVAVQLPLARPGGILKRRKWPAHRTVVGPLDLPDWQDLRADVEVQ
jgi:hypothetical protein